MANHLLKEVNHKPTLTGIPPDSRRESDALGIAIGQPIFIHEDLAHERLAPLLDTQITTEHSYFLVSSQAKASDPNLLKFTKWLRDEIALILDEAGACSRIPAHTPGRAFAH